MSKTVHLHIGTPKSGTTFLQSLVRSNRDAMADAGVLVPFTTHRANYSLRYVAFRNVDDLPQPRWAVDRWKDFGDAVARWPQDVLVTHEGMSRLEQPYVDTLMDELRRMDLEVKVVVTMRDLARLIPSAWQQSIKSGRVRRFSEYLELIASSPDEDFWLDQDLERILPRWISAVGAENVTLVTAPGSGTPPTVLWTRFAEAIGVPSGVVTDFETANLNQRLTVTEIEILRRMNIVGWERDAEARGYYYQYDKRRVTFSEHFAQHTSSSQSPTYHAELHPWVQERSRRLIKAVEASGCRLIGDIADLDVGDAPPPGTDPDAVTGEDIVARVPSLLEDVFASYEADWHALQRRMAELEASRTPPENVRKPLGRRSRILRRSR